MIPPYLPGRDWLAFSFRGPGRMWHSRQSMDEELGFSDQRMDLDLARLKVYTTTYGETYGWIHVSLLEGVDDVE